MIGFLTGTVIDTAPNSVTLLCNSVGYQVSVLGSSGFLMGQNVELWIHHVIREDASDLYGFATKVERDFLRKLITVSGVGPRIALGVMDASPLSALVNAIQNKQADVLSHLPGIGKKTAEKVCIELYNKLDEFATAGSSNRPIHMDSLEALTGLGYSEREVITFIQNLDDGVSVEEVVRLFLKRNN